MLPTIKRREFMELMGAGLATMALPRCTIKKIEQNRPNILWISIEDISPDLGCYGNNELSTPNIDRFAGEGVTFTNAFTVTPVCSPNRSGIITGMYPPSIGSMHMPTRHVYPKAMRHIDYETVPPPYVKCFTEYLRAAGYYCTNRSKTDHQFMAPLTAWDANRDEDRSWYINESIPGDWEGRAVGQPFFSVINHSVTHEGEIRRKRDYDPIIDPDSVTLPPYYPDTPVVRKDWARYLDNIVTVDTQVGELLARLERDGLAENTVVFIWSDHGRGLPRGKRWVYDSGIHVPLIIRWPGVIKPGTVSDELVSSIDFGPAVLSIAGVQVPSYMHGQPFIGEQKAEPRDYVFAHRDRMGERYDMIRCVRDKRFKYIKNFQPEKPYAQHIEYMDTMPTMQEWRRLAAEGKLEGPQKLFFQETKPVEELYDIQADPHEINNLADDPKYKDVLKRMGSILDTWMEEINDLGHIPEEELIERFEPGGIQYVTEKPTISPGGATSQGSETVYISCPTEGASIAYTTESGEDPHWLLYSDKIELTTSTTLRARAHRLGYVESPEVRADFRII